LETLNLVVTDDGDLRADAAGQPIHCALDWTDLPAFYDQLMQRLVPTSH
jgi:hypothetical protein